MSLTVRLHHGTSTSAARFVLTGGLRGRSHWTDDPDLADYYAQEAADSDGSHPQILAADLALNALSVDVCAIEEPVLRSLLARYRALADAHDISVQEAVWHAADQEVRQAGCGDWSRLDGAASLRLTGCAVHAAPVAVGDVFIADHQ